MQLLTERLLLRPVEVSDAEAIYRMHLDPEVSRFLEAPASSLEETVRRIKRHLEKSAALGVALGLKTTLLRSTGQFIGWCGYLSQEVNGISEVEVAYRLAREFWGYGYATEAASGLACYAFNELGLSRVIALIHPRNTSSIRVAERAGFEYERDVPFQGQLVCMYRRTSK